MSEPSDILPSGTDADLQEQGRLEQEGAAPTDGSVGAGTGGSEADLQEQAMPVDTADAPGGGIADEGTGGSEADRLEQAAEVPDGDEEAFSYGTTEDGPAV